MAYKKKVVYSDLTNNIYLAEVNEKGMASDKPKEDITGWCLNLVGTHLKDTKNNYKLSFDDGDYILKLVPLKVDLLEEN